MSHISFLYNRKVVSLYLLNITNLTRCKLVWNLQQNCKYKFITNTVRNHYNFLFLWDITKILALFKNQNHIICGCLFLYLQIGYIPYGFFIYCKHWHISRTFLLKIFVLNRGCGLSGRTSDDHAINLRKLTLQQKFSNLNRPV